MKIVVGFFLTCIGIGIVAYTFRRYKVYGAEKSWLQVIKFIMDVLGEGLAGLGLLLILVGIILVLSHVV